jgi:hypothetical protein
MALGGALGLGPSTLPSPLTRVGSGPHLDLAAARCRWAQCREVGLLFDGNAGEVVEVDGVVTDVIMALGLSRWRKWTLDAVSLGAKGVAADIAAWQDPLPRRSCT